MTITIDKGIPIPQHGRRGTQTYPWADLAVGDSFTVEVMQRHAMASAAARYAKRHGVAFTSRIEKVDGGHSRVRVWRTA